MLNNQIPVSANFRAGTALLALALLGAGFMVAATPTLAAESAAAAGNEAAEQPAGTVVAAAEAEAADTLVVTGSRIRRAELTGLEPTISIDKDYLESRNLTNVADALNELPAFRGSVTPAGAQSSAGNGVNFLNTFGIGSNRTLTLINGRRVVSSNLPSLFGPGSAGLQVDLNIIPSVLIERIDTVSIGGAPIYGSDAIAGTINLILKNNYKGIHLETTDGITSRGDGFRYNFSGIVGKDFSEGRGNITLAISYDKQQGVRGTDRKHITDNIGTLNNCTGAGPAPADLRLNPNIGCNNGGSDGVPARILFRNLHSPYLSSGGVLFDNNPDGDFFTDLQFGNNGRLTAVDPVSNLTGFFGAGGNTYQTSDQTQVTSDLRRFSANLFAHYDVSPAATLYFEGLYYNAAARELGTSPSFNTFVFDPDVSGGLSFDTATVPFLNAADRQTLLDRNIQQFQISRSNEDLFDQSAQSKTELKRFVVGSRGDFDAIGRSFHYDVSFNYGINKIQNFAQAINQQRFINAVSIAQGPNGPVCSLNPTVPVAPDQPIQPIADPNCQPLNLFGFGQASAAARNYIREDTVDSSSVRQIVVNANIGGNLFDTWAGPVAFNVGYEHRDEKSSFNPAAFNIAGNGRNSATAPTAGGFVLNELFGETLIPLVSPENNIPFLHSVEAFGRIRYVNNTVNGGFIAWAAGGKVEPVAGVQFRGNFTRSFRAPAVTELFLPQSPTFERPSDLCTTANRAAGAAPATRTANCLAFLSAVGADPATYTLLAAQASVAGISGGNPNLKNEQSDSFTYGAVFQPRFIRGLTITADYISISIKDPIVNLSTDNLTSGCFDNSSFNTADPRNGNQFCSALGFGPDGQIPNSPSNPAVRTGFINGQSYKFRGVTGAIDYITSLDALHLPGKLNIGGDMLYVRQRIVDNTGVVPQRSDGLIANSDPRFSAQLRVNFIGKNFGFGTFVNYVGRQLASVNNRGPSPNDTREFDSYKPYATVNMNMYFRTDDNFRINFSVTNAFDRIGQSYYGYIIPASVNDDLGRRFTVRVSKDF